MVTLSNDWLLLQYKLPNEPSAPRVYIWRKLKRLGAILILDAIWILPDTPRNMEQFQWLVAEIMELGGQAVMYLGHPAFSSLPFDLHSRFISMVDDGYLPLLGELQKPEPDLERLSRQYQQVKSRDYFNSELGVKVRDLLIERRGEIE